jgi:hypothetical protein
MGRRTRARQSRYEDAREPFLLREYGGAPGWMLVASALIMVGVGAVVVIHTF